MLRAVITSKHELSVNGSIGVTYDILNGEDERNPEIVATGLTTEAAPESIEGIIRQRLTEFSDSRQVAETITVGMVITL